jgi:hypothetical protein
VGKFDAYLDSSASARLVRWPFRILAAILLAAATFAFLGMAYKAVAHHDLKAALAAVSCLPITALLVRTGGGAMLFGRVVGTPLWPFASGYVALAWVAIFYLVVQYSQ